MKLKDSLEYLNFFGNVYRHSKTGKYFIYKDGNFKIISEDEMRKLLEINEGDLK